jgi:hypothetical protein
MHRSSSHQMRQGASTANKPHHLPFPQILGSCRLDGSSVKQSSWDYADGFCRTKVAVGEWLGDQTYTIGVANKKHAAGFIGWLLGDRNIAPKVLNRAEKFGWQVFTQNQSSPHVIHQCWHEIKILEVQAKV